MIAAALCFVFYALQLWGVLQTDWAGLGALELLMLVGLGIFVADFLSGVLHLCLDYYPLNTKAGMDKIYFYVGDRATQSFLQLKQEVMRRASLVDMLSYDFKIHHCKAKKMNQKTYPVLMLETVLPALALTLLGIFLPQPWGVCLLVTGFFVAQIQFVHACVHDTPRSVFWKRVIQKLQQLGVMYSLAEHGAHHRDGQANFCLITGWANRLLNPICLWLFQKQIIQREFWEQLRRYR